MAYSAMTDLSTGQLVTEAEWDKIKGNFDFFAANHDHTGDTADGGLMHLGVVTTAVAINNSTTETSLASVTIPAGTLANANVVEFFGWGTWVQDTGSNQSMTYHVDYGATEILVTLGATYQPGGVARYWLIHVRLWETAANTQAAWMEILPVKDAGGYNSGAETGAATGTATETSSGALTLDIRAKLNTASASWTHTLQGGVFRKVSA